MEDPVLDRIKEKLLSLDPVWFMQKYLTLDGKPYRVQGNGYKPLCDIIRYIGVKALEKDSKQIVILKSRQIGATITISALEMYFMCSGLFGTGDKPPIRIVHAFPQLDLAFAFSKTKLNPMISSSIIIDQDKNKKSKMVSKSYIQSMLDSTSPTNDSLQFKQFQGGNHLWVESTGIDGQRLRGRSADILFFDEIQDMPAAALANSTKILTKAQYGRIGEGVVVYFGTPKQRGSVFWDIWNDSSQQYFYLGCEKCQKHFPLYTPGTNEWEDIWIYGHVVRCTLCGCEQNKLEATERGKWVATKNQNDAKFIGFHINQLFMPDFDLDKILREKPGSSATNTERAYQNEVLGEFFHGEAAIMSPDQIREKCGDPERKFRNSINTAENVTTFLGIDIGAKGDLAQLVDSDKIKTQGQSYSTAVLLTVLENNKLSIEFATKFKRNDLASKKGMVDQIMRQYSCTMAVCDIGYANDFNEIMQTEYGERFLSSQAAGKVNEHIKYNADIFPKVILFERDFWIADLYDQMKKGNIRFPLGDYEKIAWLIQHCTSMEIKPTVSRTGDINPHYVKGTTPNDGFMSLLNAYIGYKFYISNGFKIKNPAMMTHSNNEKPPVLAAYLPGLK